MKERMISCKHCGERIRPDEEKCPFCNKKLEVDYASLYPAHQNKKYYMFLPNSVFGKTVFSLFPLIEILLCGSLLKMLFDGVNMKPGAWIYLTAVCLPFVAIIAFFVFLLVVFFNSYMIWDGKETVTVKKLRGSKRYSLSAISRIARCITVNAKGHAVTRYVIIVNEDTPMIAFYNDREIREFFLHFGIKEVLDNDMKYSWYKEKMLGE